MISKYFHTIRFLKFKQIYYRIWFSISRPIISHNFGLSLRNPKNNFCLTIKKKASLINKDTFNFLNKTKSLSKIGWNCKDQNICKLWLYNQHYFDDLNALGSANRKVWHYELLKNWVSSNPIGYGIGWDSYPTSLRIVNWIKWHLSKNTLPKINLHSLIIQARWLNKRIEWHILGNHLFVNAKALVFAGLFFSGKEADEFIKKGLKIINNELKEQVLGDGGNYERTPMYHGIFLEDILDLINIARVYPEIIPETQVNHWIKISIIMLKWLETMTHPDGEISFFNDAALKIAPNLDQLKKYAQRLDVNYNSFKFKKVTSLKESGYVRLTSNKAVALLDVAPIGPDYQPGHAHADTLSFELSIFGQRLFVNCGTSEYGISSVRKHERSTKAHNTVVVNSENSSEVWSGFRVAKRAYPIDLKIEELKHFVSVTCSHDGYKRITGKPIHRRNWQFFESSLIINDSIEGSFKSALAYFHFHPQINILKGPPGFWNLTFSNNKNINLYVQKGLAQLEASYYSPEFGKKIETKCLKVVLDKKDGSSIKISW
ncbi:heparinase II/III family protein [Pelagibacteraceae bacterium]|nr:heparinase II/III family protein [Pelagibacteraceae bacterium]